jgi:hypothetical protein
VRYWPNELNKVHPIDIVSTFLGAHAIPKDQTGDEYVDVVINEMLPKTKGLARFCDVFCEQNVFTIRQSRDILMAGKKHGLFPKIHADEIIDTIYRWSNLAHSLDFMKLFIINNQPKNYDKLSEQWWKICRFKSMRFFEKYVPQEYKQEMVGQTGGRPKEGKAWYWYSPEAKYILKCQYEKSDYWDAILTSGTGTRIAIPRRHSS